MPPESSPAEPETLDAASVAELTTDTRTPDTYLDGVADYLKGGALTSARILAQVFGNTENDPEQIAALDRQMQADPRFLRGGVGGMEWDLACLPPEARAKTVGEMYDEAKKNHEAGKSIGDCIAANEASADKIADKACTCGAPLTSQEYNGENAVPGPDGTLHAFHCSTLVKVAAVEGTGSETIASDTPGGVVNSDPND